MQSIVVWIQQHILFMFAIGIVACNFAWLMVCRKKLNIKWYAALIIAILHDVIGYTAMRLWAIIEVGGDLGKAANMRLFGAVFVLPLLYCAWAKLFRHETALVMDASAICLSVGLLLGRINCLLGGCCIGTLIPGRMGWRWPIREVEIIYYVAFIAWYSHRIICDKTHGQVYPVFMISYGGLRFILEWFRVEYSGVGGLHLGTIWSVLSIIIGLSIFFAQQEKQTKKRRVKKK